MAVSHANNQLFVPNIIRDRSPINNPKMRKYQQVDDMHAMLNDDLEKCLQRKKTKKKKKIGEIISMIDRG